MNATKQTASMPMADINTTPLIDVLLVLLIIMLLSVPVASNITPVDLPRPSPETRTPPLRPQNTISVTSAGSITWNGSPVAEAELAAALVAVSHLASEPLVKLEPEPGAPYGVSARVIRLVKQSGIASFAFVGNERFADFGKPAPVSPLLR